MDPPLSLGVETVDGVIVVTVPESRAKPHSVNGHFYLREGANTQRMRRDEIREFFFREGLIQFDSQPSEHFSLERDLDPDRFRALDRA